MGLFEFFFPEEAQAEHLKDIASTQKESVRQNWRENSKRENENRSQAKRITQLENDVGTIALVLGAIMKKLDNDGQVTYTELKELFREMDLIDDVRDGKINVEDLREGAFLSKDQ